MYSTYTNVHHTTYVNAIPFHCVYSFMLHHKTKMKINIKIYMLIKNMKVFSLPLFTHFNSRFCCCCCCCRLHRHCHSHRHSFSFLISVVCCLSVNGILFNFCYLETQIA